MVEISIEIVSNYDLRIFSLLESIRKQTFQDYETIVSTDSQELVDLIKSFDIKIAYRENAGVLYRRMMAHKLSNGKKSLLLEASRFLSLDALYKLSLIDNAMIVVEEKDMGKNFITRVQNIERSANVHKTPTFSPNSLIVEPRVFSKPILDTAFQEIKAIPYPILIKMHYGDLDIIYHEAFKISHDISATVTPLIYHYTDENVFGFIKKYYTYGKSNKYIKMTKYSKKFTLRNHLRPYYGIKESLQIYSLWLIKALAFGLGQFSPFTLNTRKPEK